MIDDNAWALFMQDFGELKASIKSLGDGVKSLDDKAEKTIAFQAATQERLINGNKKFQDHEDRIKKVEEKKCPKYPRPSLTYAMISFGFIVLGILISIIK